jgi:molybdate-binding protein
MSSLTDLREIFDVVIGVDTHVQTHSAAAVDVGTGGHDAGLTRHLDELEEVAVGVG